LLIIGSGVVTAPIRDPRHARLVAAKLISQRWWQQYRAWSIIIEGVLAALAAGLTVFIRRLQKKRNER
jgi:hypothetical protein